jgi:thiamine pyrophosphate-dependent acetolactate synthase large subunit-like protein
MAPTDLPSTDLVFAALRRRPTSAKVSVAELCGARGLSVRESGELDDVVADGLAADGPALAHVRTDVRPV